jgi:NADPH-dependent ferric siderophore reductase
VSQPRRSYEILPASRWLRLAGHESAVPTIATILESVTGDLQVEVLTELEEGHEPVPLPAGDHIRLDWLTRSSGAQPGSSLTTEISAWAPPPGPGQAWAGCEAVAVRTILQQFLGRLATPADQAGDAWILAGRRGE